MKCLRNGIDKGRYQEVEQTIVFINAGCELDEF